MLNQLVCVFGLLVFEHHRMHHALDVPRSAIAHWAFCKLTKSARFRNQCVHQFAAYRLRSSPESAQRDPIRGLGSFKLLYRLSTRPDLLADLVKRNAESFADGRDPATRRAGGRRPHILKGAVKLR